MQCVTDSEEAQMTTTAVAEHQNPAPTSSAITIWIHDRWEIVHSQWAGMPDTLRALWEQLSERLRNALDIPTQGELRRLSDRLDQIDARLAALAEGRTVTALASQSAVGSAPPSNGAHAAVHSVAEPPTASVKARADKRPRKR